MEAIFSSEITVNFYRTTGRDIQEDSTFQSHHRKKQIYHGFNTAFNIII
jgi:hypothetical protein